MRFICILMAIVLVRVESKVCKSVDVRNTPDHLLEFSDCRIIEGHLQVVLIENFDDTSYYNRSFAELYEITDYLIVFDVFGLRSLDLIFPKLTSIRGNSLFRGYSLVLYHLSDLEEISLTSLRYIGNGGVKIGKCPKLCYIETVNWEAIGASHLTVDQLPKCEEQFCPRECKGNCWSNFKCQNLTRTNCHPLCIGCSQPNSPKHCDLCKFFNNNGTCVQNCPISTIIDNYSGRCLNQKECASKNGSWAVFADNCVPSCPPLYEKGPEGNCTFAGKRICEGIKINYKCEIGAMLNCTHINGSLHIALYGYVDMFLLEKFFGNIVSISGYLHIMRSSSITSLQFLKKLRRIKGEKLWSLHYSIFVAENPNLQTLWDFGDNTTLLLEKGEALFQNNPHLCSYEIDKLKNVVTNRSNNNGYQTSCNLTELNVTVVEINPSNITFTWDVPARNGTVIGHIVYYIKEEANSTTLFVKDGIRVNDGQSECGWNDIFVSNNSVQLVKLDPLQRYAYYIRTIFTPGGAIQSRVYTFETAMGEPSEPVDLVGVTKNDSSIELVWKKPSYINGDLSHYKLAVYIEKDNVPMIQERNYCTNPHLTCDCTMKEEIRMFVPYDTCIGTTDPHFCNEKTLYNTKNDSNDESVVIRLGDQYSGVQEFDVDIKQFHVKNGRDPLRLLVSSLSHFTMYTFYLRACNKKRGNESDHCGGPAMTYQRTGGKKDGDVVKNLNVKVEGPDVSVTWTRPARPNTVVVAYHLEYKRVDLKRPIPKKKCLTSWQYDSDECERKLVGLESGKYAVRIMAVSLAGSGQWSPWKYVEVRSRDAVSWGYAVLGVLSVLILFTLMFIIWRRYKMPLDEDERQLINSRKFFEEDDEWKLDDETIQISRELGQNSVGVYFRNSVR